MKRIRLSFLIVLASAVTVLTPVNADWPWCMPSTPFEACNDCILARMNCYGDPCTGFCAYDFYEAHFYCQAIGTCP